MFLIDRHDKWKNGESHIRQYRCYVYFCTKRGLPKSKCRKLLWEKSLKIRYGNGVPIVVRVGESPAHGEVEQSIFNTNIREGA